MLNDPKINTIVKEIGEEDFKNINKLALIAVQEGYKDKKEFYDDIKFAYPVSFENVTYIFEYNRSLTNGR